MMKKLAALLIFFVSVLVYAVPAVVEDEDVRIYTPVEFFSADEAGNKGASLGMPEMMEGGIKAKVLEVGKMEENGGEKGNWCKIRLRLGMWMEDTAWVPKESEVWCFIPEDAKIFRN